MMCPAWARVVHITHDVLRPVVWLHDGVGLPHAEPRADGIGRQFCVRGAMLGGSTPSPSCAWRGGWRPEVSRASSSTQSVQVGLDGGLVTDGVAGGAASRIRASSCRACHPSRAPHRGCEDGRDVGA